MVAVFAHHTFCARATFVTFVSFRCLYRTLTMCTVVVPSVGAAIASPTVTPIVRGSGNVVAVSTMFTGPLCTVRCKINDVTKVLKTEIP